MPTRRSTRRSVSMRGELFETLSRHAETCRVPVAALVERLILEHLDREGVAVVEREEYLRLLAERLARYDARTKSEHDQHFGAGGGVKVL